MSESDDRRVTRDHDGGNLGAYYVRALFDRHNVPQEKRAGVLSDTFGLSYSAAHRRNMGLAPWPLEDVQRLAERFGESLGQMIGNLDGDDGDRATFDFGEVRKSCKVWLGALLREGTAKEFVATRVGRALKVTVGGVPGSETYAVTRLVFEATHSIAVLDDEPDIADSIAEGFRKQGFRSDSYTSINRLLERLKDHPYDAYVLDWIIHKVSVIDLVKAIRAHDKECFIGILTGKFASGEADADEVTDACHMFDMAAFTKPAAIPLLSSAITRKLRR